MLHSRSGALALSFLAVGILGAMVFWVASTQFGDNDQQPTLPGPPTIGPMTLDAFHKLQKGMSPDEVADILGVQGDDASSGANVDDSVDKEEYHNLNDAGKVTVLYRNDKAVSFTESNLQ